jgi:hypothetical protein
MMRAVWSFWMKPFKARRHSAWLSPVHHLLSWVLSVETARQHYPRTSLMTDDEGAQLLVEQLGLKFDEVSTELNVLADHDPAWWALGKLYAYRAQREPFIHIDNDAYLWKPLPEQVSSSPVFAECPEPYSLGFYHPEFLECSLSNGGAIWLPAEWVWYRADGRRQRGDACGIFGGNHLDFINHYAGQAIKLVEHPDNQAGWALIDKASQNTLFEQYLLAACVEYHRWHIASPYHGIEIRYLFDTLDEAYDSDRATQLGYTHLLGESKRHEKTAMQMVERVKQDYPNYYERCLSLQS